MTLADRIYICQGALHAAEEDFGDELSKWLGRCWWEGDGLVDDYHFDVYDRSFELTGCADDLSFSPEGLVSVWLAGFHRFWINHKDGTETRYAKGSSEGFRRKKACP